MKYIQRIPFSEQRGMTLVEVAVVVPIMMVFLIALFESMLLLTSTINKNRNDIYNTSAVQTAFNVIEKDVSLTSRFLPTKDTDFTDAYMPSSNGGIWSYKGDSATSRTLILRLYATTINPEDINRRPVFLDTEGCGANSIYYNDALQYNTIYFVENNELHRRRLINTSSSTCDPQYQQQSCPSLEELLAKGISSRDVSCSTDDEIIAENVESFSVQYFSNSSNSTPMDVYATTPTDNVIDANAIEITLTASKKSMNKTSSVTSTIRMSKLNIVTPAM